jgi:X-X-X-Leu-X-X-Gly heptad repeat protein
MRFSTTFVAAVGATVVNAQGIDSALNSLGNQFTSGLGDITSGFGDITSGAGSLLSSATGIGSDFASITSVAGSVCISPLDSRAQSNFYLALP